jgi:hypothetical protein
MISDEALHICRIENKRVRSSAMPPGDWVAYCNGSPGVATEDLWSAHAKAAAMANGGRLEVRPYYLYYNEENKCLTMLQIASSFVDADNWEVID